MYELIEINLFDCALSPRYVVVAQAEALAFFGASSVRVPPLVPARLPPATAAAPLESQSSPFKLRSSSQLDTH